jgi:hypothetical protein
MITHKTVNESFAFYRPTDFYASLKKRFVTYQLKTLAVTVETL